MNPLYSFSADHNAVAIHSLATPRPWTNRLWSEKGYIANVSASGDGPSYSFSDGGEMCQLNRNGERYLYLRDEATGRCWNPGLAPLLEPVENFSCQHALGSTRISSDCHGWRVCWELLVPPQDTHEVWSVDIVNTTGQARTISLFSAISFELEGFSYPRYYEMYRTCRTFRDEALGGVFCQSRHPFAPHARYHAFLCARETPHATEGNLEKFLGHGSWARPTLLLSGADAGNSEAALFVLGGVLQHRLTVEAGSSRTVVLVAGLAESLDEARGVRLRYQDSTALERLRGEIAAHLAAKYDSLSIRCPDRKIERMMNGWSKKQVDFCLVGKKGVRDNLQIADALLMYRPERAREGILETLRHQFQDGHAVLTWYPLDATRYSDQPFWIVWAVCDLIKETGDFSILEEMLPYQDGGQGTVHEHLLAAVRRLLDDRGAHGLTKIFFADWNDALNVTDDAEAESVMLSAQTCLALRELARLEERLGRLEEAAWLRREASAMARAINTHAWDGDWYLRVLSARGNIGGQDSPGSQIYLNAQVWAILAGIPGPERLPRILQSIERMIHDFGYPINHPPYPEYSPHVGRMSGMLPGLYENGGVYCHATAFKIYMDCLLGRSQEAWASLHKIMPDSEANPSSQSGAEPYLFTNCYSIHPGYYGRSYQSWQTGTSAWCQKAVYEGILGLRRDYDGLHLSPCLPPHWETAEATRTFRGCRYRFSYRQSREITAKSMLVDGQPWEGDLLPHFADALVHQVEVRLPKPA